MTKRRTARIFCSIIFLLSWLLIGAVPEVKPPEAEITNGLIYVHFYLPDPENGYYRAVRFDRSEIVSDFKYKSHSYYGLWFDNYSPTKNDAIMGPVEAFDPIGFNEAKPGESFVKIGIGELTKPDDKQYDFTRFYSLVSEGKWKVKSGTDQVQFMHELKGREYSYEYTKIVKLIKNKPVMVLSHTLKNTGRKTIETAVFNHNFFVIDKQPTGPGFEVTFPSNITEKLVRMQEYANVQDNKLIFLKELNNRNVSFRDVTGGKGSAYEIRVDNRNTGAGVKITGDQPISKMVFWSAGRTVCLEPYLAIRIDPGKTFQWNITYEYYINDSLSKK